MKDLQSTVWWYFLESKSKFWSFSFRAGIGQFQFQFHRGSIQFRFQFLQIILAFNSIPIQFLLMILDLNSIPIPIPHPIKTAKIRFQFQFRNWNCTPLTCANMFDLKLPTFQILWNNIHVRSMPHLHANVDVGTCSLRIPTCLWCSRLCNFWAFSYAQKDSFLGSIGHNGHLKNVQALLAGRWDFRSPQKTIQLEMIR